MKLILAFAAGVALTSIAFVLFDKADTRSPSELDMLVASGSQLTPEQVLVEETPDEPRGPIEPAAANRPPDDASGLSNLSEDLTRIAQTDWTREDALDLLGFWTEEEVRDLERRARETSEPTEEMQEAERVMYLAQAELARRENVAKWADAPPPDVPIELPPEFGYLSEFPDASHESLQREAIDPDWSPQMEAQILNFFTTRTQLTGTFGSPTIHCRTSGCEVAFVSYGVIDAGNAAQPGMRERMLKRVEFQASTEDLYEQPWAAELNRGFPDPRFQDGGATTILWHIGRAED